MPFAASLVNHGEQRKKDYDRKKIPGMRSLHRGINIHQNKGAVKEWARKDPNKQPKNDPRELMVHHQKIDADLKDVYSRTAALTKDNMTMQERVEQGWKDFENIGGKRPKKVTGFREHLNDLRQSKKDMRERASVEFSEKGEFTDYGRDGSALHDMKDKRIKKFVKGQLDRAHMLRRFGDPTPLKQSGKFDRHNNTFTMFNKEARQVKRQAAHKEKFATVKDRKKNSKSMWDLKDSGKGINQRGDGVIKHSNETGLDIGRNERRGGFGRQKRGRSAH